MQRDYEVWHSPHLNRPMEFLWFGWSGRPLLMFPTSGGRYKENEDFGLVGALADKVEAGQLQIICVDSIDHESWYNKWAHPADRVRRHDQFDKYLRWELAPYIAHRAQRGDLIVYGASFGAYHATNFAARYPEVVSRAVMFSGIYDIHQNLDGYWDDDAYFHCPTAYIPNMSQDDTNRLKQVGWVVATGEHDSLVNENRWFAAMLSAKGIPNHSEIWPGVFGHDWPWWKENLRRFVP
jgi:esterase/lipase superfamily enzyme